MDQYFMDMMEIEGSDLAFSLLNGEDDDHHPFFMQPQFVMQYMPTNKFANHMGRYRDSEVDDLLRMRRSSGSQNIMRGARDWLKKESEFNDPFSMNRHRFMPFEGRNNNFKGKDVCYDVSEEEEIQARTIIVENLSDDSSEEKLKDTLRVVGSVKSISVRNPCDPQLAGCSKDVLISEKLHAIVEYETSEAAKRAENKEVWENGIRVRKMLTAQ